MKEISQLGVEIYKDAARPAVSEVGAVVGRSAKALLAPIRGFLWCWEKIEEYVETEVQKRLEKVPETQKCLRPQYSLEIKATNSVVFVNDYGKQFRQACR